MNNKTLIAVCLIVFLFGSTLQAQLYETGPREKFSFGIKAGVNLSNVWDEQGDDFRANARMGFVGGVFGSIPIGRFLGFQPEVLYSQKGFQGEGTLLLDEYSFSRTTSYIDIPLLLQIKPMEYFTLVLGPQYSYLLNEENKYTFGANSTAQQQEFENDNIRKNTLGFLVGVDGYIASNFVISGRAGWDFQENNGDGSSHTPRYKNRWLQLTLGIKL